MKGYWQARNLLGPMILGCGPKIITHLCEPEGQRSHGRREERYTWSLGRRWVKGTYLGPVSPSILPSTSHSMKSAEGAMP